MAYASWYHWNCGGTQPKAATINQFACPSYSLYVQLLWYPMYYTGRDEGRVSPVQWSKPQCIRAPKQDSNPGRRIQNHKQNHKWWPLHYHMESIRSQTRNGPLIQNPKKGARGRGRSRKTWEQCVRDDMKLLGLHSEWAIFKDMWRDLIWGKHLTLA